MRPSEEVCGWEVRGLERRLGALEERLDRCDRGRLERQQRRLDYAVLLFWIAWAAVMGGMVVLAAQS